MSGLYALEQFSVSDWCPKMDQLLLRSINLAVSEAIAHLLHSTVFCEEFQLEQLSILIRKFNHSQESL